MNRRFILALTFILIDILKYRLYKSDIGRLETFTDIRIVAQILTRLGVRAQKGAA